jgi:hypothetical protein
MGELNLLDFYRAQRNAISILIDDYALFVLGFIDHTRPQSYEVLSKHFPSNIGLAEACRRLHAAGMIEIGYQGNKIERLVITKEGKDLLDLFFDGHGTPNRNEQSDDNVSDKEARTANTLPKCQKCKSGDLIPLSDFGTGGAPIHFKGWVCTNPTCGFNIKSRNGDIFMNEPIHVAKYDAIRERQLTDPAV